MKRCLSLLLMVLMLLSVPMGLASCGPMEDKGAIVNMYYVGEMYDFDPARSLYDDDAMRVLSLLYEPLFKLKENGKVEPALAEDYEILRDTENDVYQMEITLRKTAWSDGTPVKASDVVYAWQRIIEPDFPCEAAALLYDIQGALEVKNGDLGSSIGDFKVTAEDATTITITFRNFYDEEGKILRDEKGNAIEVDYDAFLRNLTSISLAPVCESVVSKAPEYWSRYVTTIVTNGAFGIRSLDFAVGEFTLERNRYYNYENKDLVPEGDDPDKHVTPYQLVTTWGKATDREKIFKEQLDTMFAENSLFLMAEMPFDMREKYEDDAVVTDALSTMSLYFNLATPRIGADKGIKDAEVRKALSMALDREAIADLLVFAKPATGFISHGVFENAGRRKLFREETDDLLPKNADLEGAKAAITAKSLKSESRQIVLGYVAGEKQQAVAEYIKTTWRELGFLVTLRPLSSTEMVVLENGTIKEADALREGETIKCRYEMPYAYDLYRDFVFGDKETVLAEYEALAPFRKESYWGDATDVEFFDVLLVDAQMLSPDAFAPLAAFSTAFNGNGVDISLNADATQRETNFLHVTGYASEAYDALILKAYREPDLAKRAEILHDAEEQLLADMPVIPLTFGQTYYVKSKKIKGIKTDYYGYPILTDMKLKNYQDYLPDNAE